MRRNRHHDVPCFFLEKNIVGTWQLLMNTCMASCSQQAHLVFLRTNQTKFSFSVQSLFANSSIFMYVYWKFDCCWYSHSVHALPKKLHCLCMLHEDIVKISFKLFLFLHRARGPTKDFDDCAGGAIFLNCWCV